MSFVVRQAVTGDAGNIDVVASVEKGVAQVCELLRTCAYTMNHHDGFGGFLPWVLIIDQHSDLTSVFEESSLTVRFAAAMASL